MPSCAWEAFFSSSQLRRWQEAMDRRFSCRQFRAQADIQQLSALHYAAGRAQLPGVRILFSQCDSNQLFPKLPFLEKIEYASQYAVLLRDPAVPQSLLHAGISGEALQLEMASLGLGSCWVRGTYRRRAVDVARRPGERIAAVMPYGQPLDPEGSSHRHRKPLKELCLDDPARWPLWAYQAAEAVRGAPSAANRQPWRFSFSGSTLRLSGRGFGGLHSGIAVLHMECALRAQPHHWRLSWDEKSLLISLEESHDTV
ncbi:MAG: nitroreductase family protein [Christensenellales bacterium]